MTLHFQSQGNSSAKSIQSPRRASHILMPGVLFCALLGAALLSVSATTDAAGGEWLNNPATNCDTGSPGMYYVGKCSTSGDASDAEVVFDATTGDAMAVYGGASTGGNGSNNTVAISGGNVSGFVNGGYSSDGDASNNTVTVSGGTVFSSVSGGQGLDGKVIGNTVTVSGGKVTTVFGSYINSGEAIGNIVTISGGIVSGNVYGSYINSGEAIGNTVTISGGIVSGNVYGGSGDSGGATGNTVTISGGTAGKDVYGGYSELGGATTNNRVSLSGSPIFGGTSVLYGGNSSTVVTGNILDIHTKDLTAYNVKNFEQYHFILPADIQSGEVVLKLTDPGGVNLNGAKVGVAIQGGSTLSKIGDQVTLIDSVGTLTADNIQQINLTGYHGVSLEYSFNLSSDANHLYATTGSAPAVRDQAKAPIEGRASTMALSLQGADLLAGAGMSNALSAVSSAGGVSSASGASGIASFGALSGGRSRYHSGSHTDVNGVGLMLGLAKNFSIDSGNLVAGAFFEGGRGHYDTYNAFDSGVVRGSGRADYFGVGLLARHDWDSGLYAEGSVRGGRMNSDWSSRDMGAADASYDTSTPYYGAHMGLGFVWSLNERTTLDLSAKYFWTHQRGDEARISGDPYNFDATDSQRTRLGARVSYAFNNQFTGYAGAAWEHEYDGVARATVYGLSTPSPSLKGDTGVFEIGFNAKPDAKSPLTLGLGMQAYTGKREGVSGTLDVSWAF